MGQNKIFKIDGDLFDVNLTVDTTLITVDTTLITADATIESSYPYMLRVVPRVTTNNIGMSFKNQLTKEVVDVDILYFQYDGEHIQVYFNYEFEEGDSFEITLINLNVADERRNRLWRGTGYATMQDDLENYKLNLKNDDDIIIMD